MYYKEALIIQGKQEGASGVGMSHPCVVIFRFHCSRCEVLFPACVHTPSTLGWKV